MTAKRIFILLAATTLSAAPAAANSWNRPHPTPAPNPTPVPEPSDVGLFAMGVGGVAIGRWMHARRARRDRKGDRDE